MPHRPLLSRHEKHSLYWKCSRLRGWLNVLVSYPGVSPSGVSTKGVVRTEEGSAWSTLRWQSLSGGDIWRVYQQRESKVPCMLDMMNRVVGAC